MAKKLYSVNDIKWSDKENSSKDLNTLLCHKIYKTGEKDKPFCVWYSYPHDRKESIKVRFNTMDEAKQWCWNNWLNYLSRYLSPSNA